MMLTVDELNTKMSEMFMSSQLNNINWSTMTEADKLIALTNAHIDINRLQFIGRKLDEDQEDAFPRIIYNEIVDIPELVKSAICRYVYDFTLIMNNDRYRLASLGVVSRKVHNIAETYDIEHMKVSRDTYKKYLVDWIYRGR